MYFLYAYLYYFLLGLTTYLCPVYLLQCSGAQSPAYGPHQPAEGCYLARDVQKKNNININLHTFCFAVITVGKRIRYIIIGVV